MDVYRKRKHAYYQRKAALTTVCGDSAEHMHRCRCVLSALLSCIALHWSLCRTTAASKSAIRTDTREFGICYTLNVEGHWTKRTIGSGHMMSLMPGRCHKLILSSSRWWALKACANVSKKLFSCSHEFSATAASAASDCSPHP